MITLKEINGFLKKYGDPQTKKTHISHGAKEPLYGVKVGDLKKILKLTGKNHELSLQLFATGNSDAMYLAGLMADEKRITKEQLTDWVEKAYWYYLSEYAVPWVTAETDFGFELGLEWIESDKEHIASAGWATLSSFASINTDESLDLQTYSELLDYVSKKIHLSQNRVKYTMNNFVIATGCFISALCPKALRIAGEICKVTVNMNGTSCKVPLAETYIQKVIDKQRVGLKKKTARC